MPEASRAAGTIHDRFSSSSPGLRFGRNSRIGVKPASCSTMRWIVISLTLKLVRMVIGPRRRRPLGSRTMLARGQAGDNGDGRPDCSPISELLLPGPVDDAKRAAMAHREDLGLIR